MRIRHRKTMLVLAGVFAVALISGVLRRLSEPVYHGKSVSFWVAQWRARTGDWTETTNAFYQIGPQAVPYVAAKLSRDHSWLAGRHREAWAHLPGFLSKRVSPPKAPFEEVSPVNIFAAIGPRAILPVIGLLKDDSTAVRASAAWALGSFRRGGHGDELTISALTGVLSDPDAHVRWTAAQALGEFGPTAAGAVPALVSRLLVDAQGVKAGSKIDIRPAAARALGRIGPHASAANALLSTLQTDPDRYLRMEASIALWRINRQPDGVLPTLIVDLPGTAYPSKWEIFQALGEMGAAAKAAAPAIIKELKSDNSEVRQCAAEALWKIDPKQAPAIVDALIEPFVNPGATSARLFSLLEGARLLGEIGPEARAAVPALTQLRAHSDPRVSNAVISALHKIEGEPAAKPAANSPAP